MPFSPINYENSNFGMSKIVSLIPIAALACISSPAQVTQTVPRIVVNITVDQLRSDYMNAFMPVYGEKGFKRLLKDGKVYNHAEYPQSGLSRASSIATVSTGTVPYDHGIIGEEWLDRKTLRPVSCVDDDSYEGLLTAEKTSPVHLTVSTIGDELKIASEGKSVVYAISPFRDASVLGAGHAADGAFWINRLTGRWCGTSYYGAFPTWASAVDRQSLLDDRLKSTLWKPISELSGNFSYFLSGGVKKPFEHRFKGDLRFTSFLTSGLVNEYVCDFALACINGSGMGNDEITDYLSVTFYAGNFESKPVADYPMELQDTYLRLDQSIARLIDSVESKVGKDHVLVVLTSTGYCNEETRNLYTYRIPTGTFYISRTAGLLNMYLGAIFGNGQYIDGTYGNAIYLNHKLLEEKQISLGDVLGRCEEILLQSDGVKEVYTSQRLVQGAWTPSISKIRNSYNSKVSGDILVQVSPGWYIFNEDTKDTRLVRESYVPFPIIFYGNRLESSIIETPVSVDCIAATIAQVVRIRAPNACSSAALGGFSY